MTEERESKRERDEDREKRRLGKDGIMQPWLKRNIWLSRLAFAREVVHPKTKLLHQVDVAAWKRKPDGSWLQLALTNKGDTLGSLTVNLDLVVPTAKKHNRPESFHRVFAMTFLLPKR